MNFFGFIVVLAISYFVGVFGWAQIVGGFQNLKERGSKMWITIILWVAIITGSFFLVYNKVGDYLLAWIIAMAISFIQIISSGKIR